MLAYQANAWLRHAPCPAPRGRGALRRPPGVRRGRPHRSRTPSSCERVRGHREVYVASGCEPRRPGRGLGAEQHRLGRRRTRRLVRRRHAGAGQLALHRARGRRRRRAHRRRAGRGRTTGSSAAPGRATCGGERPGVEAARSSTLLADLDGPIGVESRRGDRLRSRRRSSPDDVADILFTSGTTGRPKGAMSAHRQTIGVARAWAELGGVRQDDRYLVVNPFFHSFGYKIGIVVGLLTGATLYPVRDVRPRRDDAADRVASGSRCCPARRRSTSRCSTLPAAPTATCPRCGSRSPAPPSCRSC